ncbi:hypothetical protein JCM10450v2_006753 [Rhodotorula kratochvilovae]
MSADDLFAPNGAFATDWLAQGAATDFDAPSAAAPSYDQDPLAFLSAEALGGLDGYGETAGKGMGAGLTQDELARALLGGFDAGGERMGEMSSAGTSTGGGRSDAGSSPFSSGLSYSGASVAPSTSSAAFDFDAVLAQSPSFSLPSNLACDFDTSALQDLFTNSAPSATSGVGTHLSPFPPAPAPLQPLSPASSVSPYAASLATFPQQSTEHFDMSTFDPTQLFVPAPSSGSSPSAPHLSVDFASPVSFASLSPPVTASAPTSSPQSQAQPVFTSLAATAGISVPALHAVPNPRSGPFAFSLNQDPATTALLSSGARGRTTRNRAQVPPPPPVEEPALGRRSKSPMEVIANAGLQSEVHQAPLLQLHANVDFSQPNSGMSRSASRKGAAAAVEVEQEDQKLAPGKGGKKGKKADRGHNAVEQKYRNSINNALATLRDTIPALRHLKPLPSMPVSKRKASQFTLATAAVPETPTGLVDGVTAAKTLSKGVILTKAIEYIDFLRFARESRDADIELLKGMVRDMVGGGDALVEEFERRRAVLEVSRAEENERRRAEEDDEDGTGDDEDEEEEAPAPAPPPPAKGKKAAAGTKRGRKGDAPAPAKRARGAAAAAPSPAGLSPPLTGDYRHVQAHNQAHLDTLASVPQTQHVFPPSPISSGDEQGVSPGALVGDGAGTRSGGRVLLASFMGVSFAGGLGADLMGSAVVAEETFGATAARVLTGGLVRRSENGTAVPLEPTLVDRLHPSLLSGLVALGAATIVVALIYLVLPLFSRWSSPSASPRARRRAQAVAALSALSATSTSDSTHSAARSSALAARKELLRLVDAPGPLGLVPALAKEALGWAARRATGLTWGRDGAGAVQEDAEEAVAWVRVAEIETMVGDRLSTLARLYTFLRLSNLSRSPSWPQVSPSTSRSAVDALLATHLLSLGHSRWAEAAWQRMLVHRKKADAAAGDSFVDLALTNEWETVQHLLAPETRLVKAADDLAAPSDTVPLLLVAEAACEDAMKDAWSTIFVAVAETTASSPPSAEVAVESLASLADADETASVVCRAMPEGSDLRTLALTTKVFLACYRAGASPSPSSADDLAEARVLLAQLVLTSKDALGRLSCAAPLLRLLGLAVAGPLGVALVGLVPAPAEHPANDIDLLATVTLTWLLVRRQGAFVDRAAEDEDEVVKPNPALHAQALAIRRMLASELFSSRGLGEEDDEDDEDAARVEDAKELLVDALTGVARRAAGLSGGLDEDSGVELEA